MPWFGGKSEQQKLAEQMRRKEAEERKAFMAVASAAYDRNLKKHQARFRCTQCGTPSKLPGREYPWYANADHEGSTTWEMPGDLTACIDCGRFFCDKHVEEVSGIGWLCAADAKARRKQLR